MTLEDAPWFSGRRVRINGYRINRRPLYTPKLTTPEIPSDFLGHMRGVLAPGHEVITGYSHQRIWRLGGIELGPGGTSITGKLGWSPRGQETFPQWSEDDLDWDTSDDLAHRGRVVPFSIDGASRALAVMHSSENRPSVVATVFERVLQENEDELLDEQRTTEWAVEPILNTADFISWLRSQDVVRSVGFTARLPNPEPDDAFAALWDRMVKRRATQLDEKLVTDQPEGLKDVEEDEQIRQATAMASKGFAAMNGEGKRGSRKTQYDQADRIAREIVDQMPETWDDARDLLTEVAVRVFSSMLSRVK